MFFQSEYTRNEGNAARAYGGNVCGRIDRQCAQGGKHRKAQVGICRHDCIRSVVGIDAASV